ncbi:hypothetical protein CHL76_08705 [Marinococcus halophilus]|uniref:DUF1648 domain-containing protein n=1 Tax=Marinococcus halophilus TaxID=1371 RepID=A0A510Y4G0_MARHA|nr:hypothetical protein [Marinococcus halophilus]OZT80176.1 hypothetical protein CHL76_08705 [Marinococcus halophilus]GEK58228.1 hypothetical protein MHA01_11330 [Marinococcus halophilus]
MHDILSAAVVILLILSTACAWSELPDEVAVNMLPGGEEAYGSRMRLLTPVAGAAALAVMNPLIRQLAQHVALFGEDVSSSVQSIRKAKHWCSWMVFGTVLILSGVAAGRLVESLHPEFSFTPIFISFLVLFYVGVLTAFFISGIQRLNIYHKQ